MSTQFSPSELESILEQAGTGVHVARDSLFEDCNRLIPTYTRMGVLSYGKEDDQHVHTKVECLAPSCKETFDTVFAYTGHYNIKHRHVCSQCKKCLPSPHLLDLHLSETHDSYFAAQAELKPMYSCFLQECNIKSLNAQERREHCIQHHNYPTNFRFDTWSNKLEARVKREANKMEVESGDDGQASTVAEHTKPLKNFTFGHPKARVFVKERFSKSAKQVELLESNKMVDDLMESLPSSE